VVVELWSRETVGCAGLGYISRKLGKGHALPRQTRNQVFKHTYTLIELVYTPLFTRIVYRGVVVWLYNCRVVGSLTE
jgi:hypothetical protein